MNLSQLPRVKSKSGKRLGRGLGSGRGKTAGRGMKGQKARGKVKQGFIGGTIPLYKRLPLRRGKGNRKVSEKPLVLNVSALGVFKKGSVVDLELLGTHKGGVKILGSAKLQQPLTVKVPTSKSAKQSIEKAGGKVANA